MLDEFENASETMITQRRKIKRLTEAINNQEKVISQLKSMSHYFELNYKIVFITRIINIHAIDEKRIQEEFENRVLLTPELL